MVLGINIYVAQVVLQDLWAKKELLKQLSAHSTSMYHLLNKTTSIKLGISVLVTDLHCTCMYIDHLSFDLRMYPLVLQCLSQHLEERIESEIRSQWACMFSAVRYFCEKNRINCLVSSSKRIIPSKVAQETGSFTQAGEEREKRLGTV